MKNPLLVKSILTAFFGFFSIGIVIFGTYQFTKEISSKDGLNQLYFLLGLIGVTNIALCGLCFAKSAVEDSLEEKVRWRNFGNSFLLCTTSSFWSLLTAIIGIFFNYDWFIKIGIFIVAGFLFSASAVLSIMTTLASTFHLLNDKKFN